MKNDHLIPVIVKDIAESIDKSWVRMVDKEYNALRLETIRDYCNQQLFNFNKSKNKQNNR